ncbi:unnamed protein product [Cyprideis torosa]|uniref:Mediator of RNA polymerase II transcription subunit 1 n=1 Tax=Cyprideis torosa TaxID=163714 RepID=A0A7R8WGS7_9CRUS|nr:unnamed protein product [Cyprideis torosa]CAG0898547.1 unnamed protein product [Cyprideis torosa]
MSSCRIQQVVPALATLIRQGRFTEFAAHIRGLLGIYAVSSEPDVQHKLWAAISSMERDLEGLAELDSKSTASPSTSSKVGTMEMVLSSPLGLLKPRQGGDSLRLMFFLSPQDLVSSKEVSRELVIREELGASVAVTLKPSLKETRIQTSPLLPPDSVLDGKRLPNFEKMTASNSCLLPVTFALSAFSFSTNHNDASSPSVLVKRNRDPESFLISSEAASLIFRETRIPVTPPEDLSQSNAKASTPSVDPASTTSATTTPLISLLLAQKEKLARGTELRKALSHPFLVTLPDFRQSFYLDWSSCSSFMGMEVFSIPFSHPSHVPKVLQVLRKQALVNHLLSSCLRKTHSHAGDISAFPLELGMVSWQVLSVTFEHPVDGTLSSVEFDVSDVASPRCTFHSSSPETELEEAATRILRSSLSIPLTMRCVLRRLCSRLPPRASPPVENGPTQASGRRVVDSGRAQPPPSVVVMSPSPPAGAQIRKLGQINKTGGSSFLSSAGLPSSLSAVKCPPDRPLVNGDIHGDKRSSHSRPRVSKSPPVTMHKRSPNQPHPLANSSIYDMLDATDDDPMSGPRSALSRKRKMSDPQLQIPSSPSSASPSPKNLFRHPSFPSKKSPVNSPKRSFSIPGTGGGGGTSSLLEELASVVTGNPKGGSKEEASDRGSRSSTASPMDFELQLSTILGETPPPSSSKKRKLSQSSSLSPPAAAGGGKFRPSSQTPPSSIPITEVSSMLLQLSEKSSLSITPVTGGASVTTTSLISPSSTATSDSLSPMLSPSLDPAASPSSPHPHLPPPPPSSSLARFSLERRPGIEIIPITSATAPPSETDIKNRSKALLSGSGGGGGAGSSSTGSSSSSSMPSSSFLKHKESQMVSSSSSPASSSSSGSSSSSNPRSSSSQLNYHSSKTESRKSSSGGERKKKSHSEHSSSRSKSSSSSKMGPPRTKSAPTASKLLNSSNSSLKRTLSENLKAMSGGGLSTTNSQNSNSSKYSSSSSGSGKQRNSSSQQPNTSNTSTMLSNSSGSSGGGTSPKHPSSPSSSKTSSSTSSSSNATSTSNSGSSGAVDPLAFALGSRASIASLPKIPKLKDRKASADSPTTSGTTNKAALLPTPPSSQATGSSTSPTQQQPKKTLSSVIDKLHSSKTTSSMGDSPGGGGNASSSDTGDPSGSSTENNNSSSSASTAAEASSNGGTSTSASSTTPTSSSSEFVVKPSNTQGQGIKLTVRKTKGSVTASVTNKRAMSMSNYMPNPASQHPMGIPPPGPPHQFGGPSPNEVLHFSPFMMGGPHMPGGGGGPFKRPLLPTPKLGPSPGLGGPDVDSGCSQPPFDGMAGTNERPLTTSPHNDR